MYVSKCGDGKLPADQLTNCCGGERVTYYMLKSEGICYLKLLLRIFAPKNVVVVGGGVSSSGGGGGGC